jgi:hypothetical protein
LRLRLISTDRPPAAYEHVEPSEQVLGRIGFAPIHTGRMAHSRGGCDDVRSVRDLTSRPKSAEDHSGANIQEATITTDSIVGRAFTIFWPFNRAAWLSVPSQFGGVPDPAAAK